MDIHPVEWLYLLITLLLLACSAIFSAAEIGLLSVNRFRVHQLAESGSHTAKILCRLLQQPAHVLTAILIGITALNYANEALATYWLHTQRGLPEWVPFLTLLLLVLLFAEVTPISYAAANPEIVAMRVTRMVAGLTRVLRPLIAGITVIANGVVRMVGGEPRPRPLVTGEDVLTIVDMETERGVLEEEEKALIHSIFEFTDTIVREIMVPRIDISAVNDGMEVAAAIDLFVTEHYSRLPVYQGNLDHIVGIVYAKDLLLYQVRGDTNRPIRDAIRPATFIPETKRVSELLQEFRESKQTIAVVLDEYGGTAGLVTMEDLLEELVGEIYDEYDVEQPAVEWLDSHVVIVDGMVPVDEVGALIGHDLPLGDYDTVGGLLYSRFGDVPARGESLVIDRYLLAVERLEGHRITKVRITLPDDPAKQEEA